MSIHIKQRFSVVLALPLIVLLGCLFSCSTENPDGFITVKEPIISTDDGDKVDISNNPDNPNEPNQNFSTSSDLNDLYFTDSNTGYIVGSNLVIRTTDKGESWKTLSQANLEFTTIYFENDSHGILGGNDEFYSYVFTTSNGGSTWEQVARFWYQNELTTVEGVFSEGNGNNLVILLNQRPNATQNYGHVYISDNKGQDFERIGTNGRQGISTAAEYSGFIYSISTPYWTGSKYNLVQNTISFLNNGNRDLIPINIDSSGNLSEVLNPISIILGENLNIIVGDNGRFAISSDSGNNWTIRTIPQALSKDLTSAIINGTEIIVSSEDGAIYRSDDSGVSWEETTSVGNKRISEIHRLSESEVLVIGEDGLIRIMDL